LADEAGFELAVRWVKFAFEISTEFCALVAESTFRENFPPEVLIAKVHLSLQGPVVRVIQGGRVCCLFPRGSRLEWPPANV